MYPLYVRLDGVRRGPILPLFEGRERKKTARIFAWGGFALTAENVRKLCLQQRPERETR